MTLPDSAISELQLAKNLVENPGMAAKITNYIGKPLEMGLEKLPKNWQKKIGTITEAALLKASEAAIFTINNVPGKASSNNWHKLGVAVSGGLGGFFGLPALAIEVPVSTTIMLRSIAEIARSHGESISNMETKLACLEVFALGGNLKTDDCTESGYFAVRTLLARTVSESAEYITVKGLTEEGLPIILRLLTKVAERFSIQISEKAAAQAVPLVGAAGGVLINTIFINHFQDMATGHFIIRKFERFYGKEQTRQIYDELPNLG
ncbi:EcsC family protein [Flavobacterium sp. TAB 87]|uniref:EcsC family protein n=1 Tax=Flavobacterium sp. TAB 87 TaxID=1729581 RepID=UPI00076C8ACA|nr:EcsC family protein [Flavobacterium sp. TAB 87]KVV16275.1 EcsC protein family protein [Flavobacterium sp. TAB 87]